MLRRRQRQTTQKPCDIIELVDTDEEDDVGDDDYKPELSSHGQKSVDRAAALAAGITKEPRKRRPPTKEKDKTEAPAAKKKRGGKDNENVAPNSSDAQTTAAAESNVSDSNPAPTTGRSSFWQRRKVWTLDELLAETENIQPTAARNIVKLFQNDNTIPFICRYRRDLVDDITPERLRDIRSTYAEIVDLRKKAETMVNNLEKENVLNTEIREELMCAKSTEELEFLYAPYKPASKGTLAERAKALGLEKSADALLYGAAPKVELSSLVDRRNDALATEALVMDGVCNIISHTISKNSNVLEELRRLRNVHRIMLKCSKAKASKETKTHKAAAGTIDKTLDSSRFENYFTFQADVKSIKPHQTLAINRGEKHKFLTVKIETTNYLKNDLTRFITDQYMRDGIQYPLRSNIFERALEECFQKKLQPLLSRQVRADLKEKAKKAAIEVFAKNLKQLLLMSPLKGECILGIDPGFKNGCKLALISETADVLETGVIYPHTNNKSKRAAQEKLVDMLHNHSCSIIALGNGKACRETEMWLSELLASGVLDSRCVRYSIVNENGASVYSCSDVARKEFPKMDMNEISAVSIARRLNDPLSEYVKIEPRHLGVGMYQHDISEKILTESLNDVVSECVSFVGVDLNTASLSVLKHIAGLSEKKAEKIIEYRMQKGPFKSRQDLLSVRSIGEKSFVQCAGFVRIEPLSVGGKLNNPLDCTWVHPESYKVAEAIIAKCDMNLSDIGKAHFIERIKSFSSSQENLERLSDEHDLPMDRVKFLLVALQREFLQDYRADVNKRPLFKKGLTRLNELTIGDVLTGAVTNVTHFGAFVDIGVDRDGLIHKNHMNNVDLSLGDRVTVSVIKVDLQRNHLGLRLEDQLMETDTSFTIKIEDD
ncbi:S1 RNA-binding domain-containing protein 1 [Scaptodrosophila lebanonensis]|uniref:S1 RNA-binding domain-containing protein 1 n=1 Tax=Drosophila lebanonensis TaxID=7225 RepID=A0A6J2T584_DROLE|nr:S1 RNA-binding domain-containing protein 1 [Scaptodrosophila lebanonensis]